ncbi:hypothetical protein ACFVWG_20835 [Kribbella sp. NPDC058245]|uniref:hypothetical protein n=1 Tax=Kribbella sp. NPDC058245 TaxID=3346399 RepID=UPI0036E98573
MNYDELGRSLGLPPTDPFVVRWRDLDADSVSDELERLADWVKWVADRYGMDHKVIPLCWNAHGAVVEELSALRTFWEYCFQDDAAPSDPLAFHRDLTLAVRRLREWTSLLGCTRTQNRGQP